MALAVHRITLHPDADEEMFEKFMKEELFPAARTNISMRIGLHSDRHLLVKSHAKDRVYLWIAEWRTASGEETLWAFPIAVGKSLKSRLQSFATLSWRSYSVLATAETEAIQTPTIGLAEELNDEGGWIGKEVP
jgi:hypothetical protein